MDRVSIVIPCYNSGATVGQTVASARAQTWSELEIIVVDDGSTDPATVAVLDALEDIRLLRQANAGLPAARNAGFAAATGRWVLPLDADDWLESDAVEALVGALQADPVAAFACCHLQLEGEARGVLPKSYNFFEQLFLNQLPYCILLPRALWEKVGGYDVSMRKGYEDWEFNIRLGAHGHFGTVLPRPLFHYRVSSGGMLIAQSNRAHGELWSLIQSKHPALFRLGSLWHTWRRWRRWPSTYPLALYFGWLAAHRILPASTFAALFRWLRRRSHSRRVSERL
jgi:glycosyltransferase involved in cell wall biosynthesis